MSCGCMSFDKIGCAFSMRQFASGDDPFVVMILSCAIRMFINSLDRRLTYSYLWGLGKVNRRCYHLSHYVEVL